MVNVQLDYRAVLTLRGHHLLHYDGPLHNYYFRRRNQINEKQTPKFL
jgi:hypothetical protein